MRMEPPTETAEPWWSPRKAKRVAGGRIPARPTSVKWGTERGTPISRYYVDRFVESRRQWIRGDVLEIKDRRYTTQFGSEVAKSDVLDIDGSNPMATVVADLAAAEAVPSEAFDCFLLTETLQYIFDLDRAISHAWRILKPGGVLLVTAPALSPLDSELREVDCWRFTERSLAELLGSRFGRESVEIVGYGNFRGNVAWLTGLALEDLPAGTLDEFDPSYTQLVAGWARKREDS